MRTVLAAAVTCLTIIGWSHAGDSQAAIRRMFDIPAQGLGAALQTLSKEQDVHVVFMLEDVQQLNTQGVRGEMTVDEALAQLLKGTGLRYEHVDEETVTIIPLAAAPAMRSQGVKEAGSKDKEAQKPSGLWDRFREAAAGEGASQEPKKEETKSADAKLEEVVVTAQKRKERLQDVPISISVLSGTDLDKSTVEGVTEALSRVPGIGINQTYLGGGTQVAIRGVSASGAISNGSSPVSYYLDGVPFGFVRHSIGPDPNAYDLERVEVLRGPQGTLYGASAQNGVVRVLTNAPDPEQVEFKARASTSSTDGGGDNYRADAAVNVPIIKGKLAARAVLGYQDVSGWIDRPTEKNANGGKIKNMRLRVGAQPTDNLSIGLSAWLSRSDFDGHSMSDDRDFRIATFPEPISTDFDVYGLSLGYKFPWFSVSSVTSYLDYSNDGITDLGTFLPGLRSGDRYSSDVFSQEIIANSSHGGAWRWSLGGIYRDAEDRQIGQTLFEDSISSTDLNQIFSSRSFAVFGEITRGFSDGRVELTGGLRYFKDDTKSREDILDVRGSSNADALSPRVVLTWHPHGNLMAYASYAEGFRSGFPQSGSLLSFAPGFRAVDPDTLHNYEVGTKANLWNGRLSLDSALYYIDWKHVQQSLTVQAGPNAFDLRTAQVNAGSASGLGLDFGVTARPVERLELGVNFSGNKLAMDSDVISANVVLFDKGDRLNTSPKYTVGAWGDYSFPLGDRGFEGRVAASANYTSEMDTRTIVGGARSIAFGDAMLISRASIEIESPKRWTATLYVDNVNNEHGSPLRFPILHDFLPWDTRVRPRTVGLQFEYRL